jgi:Domain of unknown function DUF29
MSESADLYERDFVAWTEQQAARIRAAAATHANLAIDWENVAEEIESLGRFDARELQSRLATIIEPLLKLQHSPVEEPRAGWVRTVVRERAEVEALIGQSPSLRARLGVLLPRANRAAAKAVGAEFEARREIGPAEARSLDTPELTPEQVLGDWFPDRQPSPAADPRP